MIAAKIDGGPITIFKRGNEFPELLLSDKIVGDGFALEWSMFGLLTGDHDGNIILWKNIEEKPLVLNYN